MPRQRLSSLATRRVCWMALLVSAVVAVAVLSVRNLYDDEILSLPITTAAPASIIRFAASADVHPPGMYLLAHFALRLVPSFRWMNLIPTAVLYLGLAAFVTRFGPLVRGPWPQILFLMLATLHPQLLMWGTSFRWYSWWTGIALVTVVVTLRPGRPDQPHSTARAITIGLLLAVLMYVNYVTVLFAPALAIALAVRDRGLERRRNVRGLVLASAVFVCASVPQLHTFVSMHLQRSGSQRSGIAGSFAHLAHGVFASEAYLPWHPLALLCGTVMLVVIARAFVAKTPPENAAQAAGEALRAFALCFFLLLGVSGLGGRPRNALLLIPVLAFVLANSATRFSIRLQQAAAVVIALWSAVGISHILGRTALAKATMNDHPEQVMTFVGATQRGCSVLVTYDPLLTFSASHPHRSGLLILSQYAKPIGRSSPILPGCSTPTLYVVRSFMGGVNRQWAERIDNELESASRLISGPVESAAFSFDPAAARKRRFARLMSSGAELEAAQRLPDYRYTITAGMISASEVPELLRRLPDFCIPEQCPNPVKNVPNSR